MLNPRDPTIVANKKSIDSFADSKSDYEIFSGLANRLGFESTFTDNKNEMEWIEFFWNENKKIAKEFNIDLPNFKRFLAERIL